MHHHYIENSDLFAYEKSCLRYYTFFFLHSLLMLNVVLLLRINADESWLELQELAQVLLGICAPIWTNYSKLPFITT